MRLKQQWIQFLFLFLVNQWWKTILSEQAGNEFVSNNEYEYGGSNRIIFLNDFSGDHLEGNDQIPQITSLAFRDGLNMGVGTSTGHILLYDIRSSRPLLIKDHFYGIPIKKLLFHSTLDQVISLDAKSVKVSRIRFYMNYLCTIGFQEKLLK